MYYEYDLRLLDTTLTRLKKASEVVSGRHIHYALKANANPLILNEIQQAGLGADCVSGGEIQRALDCGFSPEDIVFAGVGKADWEIELALEKGIGMFNVESFEELEVINEMALRMGKTARVAFRINPDIDAHTHEKITTGLSENKFGIDKSQMLDVIRLATTMKGVKFVGLHFHIGSQIMEMTPFVELCHTINDLQSQIAEAGLPMAENINVGGGLGVDYDEPENHEIADFESYFNTFAENLQLSENQRFHCELGRSVVAQCGRLVAEVLYVKHGLRKKFAIVDAGMTELIRPAMYGAFHKCILLEEDVAGRKMQVYDVVGPICESSDVFLHNYAMPEVKRGDKVAFLTVGAYGESMASEYNCRKRIQIKNNK